MRPAIMRTGVEQVLIGGGARDAAAARLTGPRVYSGHGVRLILWHAATLAGQLRSGPFADIRKEFPDREYLQGHDRYLLDGSGLTPQAMRISAHTTT